MPEVRATALPGVVEIVPSRHDDGRGFFSEVWNSEAWRRVGLDQSFVQDNHSRSKAGVMRGLHYQIGPLAQAKVIRVSRGRIYDVAVDVRRSSPTFGQWVGLELSEARWNQLLIPAGFAHGYLALEDSDVLYKASALYDPDAERVIAADDPAIGISWPLDPAHWVRSARDRDAGPLALAELFE